MSNLSHNGNFKFVSFKGRPLTAIIGGGEPFSAVYLPIAAEYRFFCDREDKIVYNCGIGGDEN